MSTKNDFDIRVLGRPSDRVLGYSVDSPKLSFCPPSLSDRNLTSFGSVF